MHKKYITDDLVTEFSRRSGYSKVRSAAIISDFRDTLIEILSNGDYVYLDDFGKFEVVLRQPRMGRNPQNGEPVPIEAKKAVKFTPFKFLKDTIYETQHY